MKDDKKESVFKYVSARLRIDIYSKLEAMAEENHRSLGGQIAELIERAAESRTN